MIKELAGEASKYHPCPPLGRHWGPVGGAGVLVFTEHRGTVYVLLSKRSRWVQSPGTWSVPGGAIEPGETPLDAALAEFGEEVHVTGTAVTRAAVTGQHVTQCPHGCGWSYSTFTVRVPLRSGRLPAAAVERGHSAWETSAVRWVEADRVAAMRLHPAFAAAWPELRDMIERSTA